MFNRKAKKLTDTDRQYIQRAKLCGCLMCFLNVNESLAFTTTDQAVEWNHHLHAGRRMEHQDGTPECLWHHQGEPRDGWTKAAMLKAFGPSRKYQGGKGRFVDTYGTDEQLRAKLERRMAVKWRTF